MHNCIDKRSIGQPDFAYLALCKACQNASAQSSRIRIGRFLADIRAVQADLAACTLQRVLALFADSINVKLLQVKISLCDQLDHIRIIAARKSAVGCHHDHCLARVIPALQIRMADPGRTLQDGLHGLINPIGIRSGMLRLFPCLLQLDGGNQLHCPGDLSGALDTASSSLNVSHGSHVLSPALLHPI